MLLLCIREGTDGEKRRQQKRATLGNLPLSSEISQHGGIVILVQHICGFDYEVTISSHMRQGSCGHGSEYVQMFLMVKISELLGLRIFCKKFRKFQTFTT